MVDKLTAVRNELDELLSQLALGLIAPSEAAVKVHEALRSVGYTSTAGLLEKQIEANVKAFCALIQF
jgi:hypothetical protein